VSRSNDSHVSTAGEAWTAERFAELRARSYKPAAFADFLRLSFARSAEARRDRPEADQQLQRWMGIWATAGVASRGVGRLPTVPFRTELCLLAGTWLMLRWHLGMLEDPAGRRRLHFSSADAATLARLWLSPRMRRAGEDHRVMVAILLLGIGTDVLDGRLARRGGVTRLGRDLDSITDLVFRRAASAAARESGAIQRLPARTLDFRLTLGFAHTVWHYFRYGHAPSNRVRAPVQVATAVALGGIAAGAAGCRHADITVLGGAAAALSLELSRLLREQHPESRRSREPFSRLCGLRTDRNRSRGGLHAWFRPRSPVVRFRRASPSPSG
jgi:phosphatidylglycerophosphate synthase